MTAVSPPGTLAVSEVFGPTFQGEGPSVGRRAGFVRLARCDLDCRWCDTPYTWNWERYDPAVEVHHLSVDDVLAQLRAMAPDRVVVTGGEPMLQQRRLVPLLETCAAEGWPVEIETNGRHAPLPDVAALVAQLNVSPKLSNSGVAREKAIVPDALAALVASGKAAFKFVVAEPADLDEVAELVDAHGLSPVFVMPEGTDVETVLERMRALADPVLTRGWHLTPRLHVLLWGDERGR